MSEKKDISTWDIIRASWDGTPQSIKKYQSFFESMPPEIKSKSDIALYNKMKKAITEDYSDADPGKHDVTELPDIEEKGEVITKPKVTAKASEVETESWKDRIKNGNATEDDMDVAYNAWKDGSYTPGPKTLDLFKEREGSMSDLEKAQSDFDRSRSGAAQPEPDKVADKDTTMGVKGFDPISEYDKVVKNKAYNADANNQAKSKEYKKRTSVDGYKGTTGYDGLLSSLFQAIESGNKYKDAIDGNEQIQAAKNLKDAVKTERDTRQNYNKQAGAFSGSMGNTIDNVLKDLTAKKDTIQGQIDELNQKEQNGNASTAEEINNMDAMKGQLNVLDNIMAQQQRTGEDMKAVMEQRNALMEKMANTPELKIGDKYFSEEDAENREAYSKYLDYLIPEITKIEQASADITARNFEAVGEIVENYGDEGQKQSYQGLQSLASYMQSKMMSMEPMTEEELSAYADAIKNANDAILNEKRNDPTVHGAAEDLEGKINKFIYFLFDDLKTGFIMYAGIQFKNPQLVYSAMEQRNKTYSEHEALFKTNVLDSFSKVNTNDITGESDATYMTQMVEPELMKAEAMGKISAQQKANGIKAIELAFEEYQRYTQSGGKGDFMAFYAANLDSGTGWAGVIKGLVQAGALNADAIMSFFKGGKSEDVSSDENLKTDVQKVGMLGSGVFDKAFNNAVGKATPKEETGPNPKVLGDKQGQLQNAMAMQKQAPQGQPRLQASNGWGGNNLG